MAASWIQRYVPLDDPELRLFCVPHAGGGPHAYRTWSDALDTVEVVAIHPPGRGSRTSEPLLTDMSEMVTQIVDAMTIYFDIPYGLFGHSLGALVGYEIVCEIHRRGLPPPLFYMASGEDAPHAFRDLTPIQQTTCTFQGLSDADFANEVGAQWGLIPKSILSNPELLPLVLPSLRADLEMFAAYTPSSDANADASGSICTLPCPVVALGGRKDATVSEAMLQSWSACCEGGVVDNNTVSRSFFLSLPSAYSLFLFLISLHHIGLNMYRWLHL